MGAYEDVLASLGQNSAPGQLATPYKEQLAAPTTAAQNGYKAPQLVGPTPSTGAKLQKIATNVFNPETANKAARFVVDIASNTVENAHKAANLSGDLNPLNPVAWYRRIQDAKNLNTVSERATKNVNEAKVLYGKGEMTKQQYDEIVSFNSGEMRRASSNLISHDLPTNVNEAIDVIDGTITLATLGVYTAAKIGALKTSEFAVKGVSEFVLNRMAAASEIAGAKGITNATATNLLKASTPSTVEKMMATAENAIMKTPSLRRNYEKLLKEIGTSANAKGFAKNAIVQIGFTSPLRRETMRMTAEMVQDARNGNYFVDGTKIGAVPQAVLLAGMALEGGPVGFVLRNTAKAGKAFKTALYGEQGGAIFIDQLNKYLVDRGMQGNLIEGINKYLTRAPKETQADAKKILQQFVGTNLQRGASDKTAYAVAEYISKNALESGTDISKLASDKIIENIMVHTEMQNLLQDFNRSGLNVVATKYDIGTQNSLVKLITKALGKEAKNINALPTAEDKVLRAKEIAAQALSDEIKKNPYWAQNQDVVKAMYDQLDSATSFSSIKNVPKVFAANMKAKGIPKAINSKLKTNGYLATVSENPNYVPQISRDAAEGISLKSKFVDVNDKLFEQAAIASPVFRSLGASLTKAGMGLDESAALAYRMVRDNASEMIKQQTGKNGREVLNALQQWAETGTDSRLADLVPGNWKNITKRTTTDVRMMYTRQIKEALKDAGITVTEGEAKAIKKALIDAHTKVPLQTLGLADTLVANAYKYVPFYKNYAKAQGAFRYTYNPFFNVQEQVETELLGQALVPGKVPYVAGFSRLWPGTKTELNGVVKQLEQHGFFNNSTLASNDINKSLMATRFGEGAQDVYVGRVSANITGSQKRSIAAAVQKIADRMGMSVEDALATNGALIEDIIRPIVQYPTHGALSSNLAKALNIAVFPSRYNIKVASLAVKALGQAPPAVQLLTINKLWEMENWMKTPEGISWQQEHNAAIQFMKWLTPIGNIQWVFDTLGAPFGKSNTSSVGDLGVIGGLPFGVISQILQDQGLFSLNTPYVSPKDGAIYSKKIPEIMKAKVAMALMDLLGSTFTYPGATIGLTQLGLPSKADLLRKAASSASLDTKYSEWQTKEYTPLDLPELDRIKQEIWAQNYSVKNGIEKPKSTTNPTPSTSPTQPGVTGGKVLTKTESIALDKAQKAASAKKRTKTTTFPTNLPQ